MADEQTDDTGQETKVTNQVVGQGDTDESPAVGAAATSSPEGEQSPAEAQRAAEGEPAAPQATSVSNTVPSGADAPEGTGPGGAVRGGYGLGATGTGGRDDVRGPSDTGSGSGGQSPMAAQRRADEAEDAFAEKPHLYVAGAFVGGLVLAQILKRLGGDDD
jgi:hypothetical protein